MTVLRSDDNRRAAAETADVLGVDQNAVRRKTVFAKGEIAANHNGIGPFGPAFGEAEEDPFACRAGQNDDFFHYKTPFEINFLNIVCPENEVKRTAGAP